MMTSAIPRCDLTALEALLCSKRQLRSHRMGSWLHRWRERNALMPTVVLLSGSCSFLY